MGPSAIHGRGRKTKYSGPLIEALRDIWCLTGRICASRLKEAMPEWLEYYLRRPNSLKPEDIQMLREISAATIDRKLAVFRKEEFKGKSTTRRSNWWFDGTPFGARVVRANIPKFHARPEIPVRMIDIDDEAGADI